MNEAPEPLRPGTLFHDQYEIVRCIGSGGMGVVYEVLHVATRRRRALKTLLPKLLTDAEAQERFRLEAVVAADVDSEHIVEVLDAGVDTATGFPFLVMELLRGENFAERVRREGPLPAAEVIGLLRQITGALDRMHAAGVVHRDLKPENLFLAERSDAGVRVKLLDFGVAKVVAESSLANTTRSLGTPAYMSPEQIRGDGDIGPAADLYALGQLAFTLLVGSSYWDAEGRGAGVYSLLVKIMAGAVQPARARAATRGVTELPAEFDAWFSRATALAVSERFESAAELVDALAWVFSLPPSAATPSRSSAVSLQPSQAEQIASAATLDAVAVGKGRDHASSSQKAGESAAGAQPLRRKLRATWLLLPTAVATWVGMRWTQPNQGSHAPSASATTLPALASLPVPGTAAPPPGDSAASPAASTSGTPPVARAEAAAEMPAPSASGSGPSPSSPQTPRAASKPAFVRASRPLRAAADPSDIR